MRLGDLDDLKVHISELMLVYSGTELNNAILDAIDNAPTVESPNQLVLRARDDAELEQLKTAWGNGEICFTPIVAYTARPKGEWIENVQSCKCSKCDSYALYWNDIPVLSNYCPNCGANMRGEEK